MRWSFIAFQGHLEYKIKKTAYEITIFINDHGELIVEITVLEFYK